MLNLLCLILAIICLSIILYLRPIHIFWDRQPVMRNYSIDTGKIGIIPRFEYTIPKAYNLEISHMYKTDISNVYSLLYENFSPYFKINYGFFYYNINLEKSTNICLKNNNTIIGFIHGRPMVTNYNGIEYSYIYVDYLCIKNEYRKQDAATLLISAMLNSNSIDQSYIFKIDTNRLPFLPFIKSRYYYKLLENNLALDINNKITISQFSDMEKNKKIHTLNFINEFLKKYQFYKEYTIEELEIYKVYIIGDIDLVIIGKDNHYTIANNIYKSFDIDYIVGNNNFYHIFEKNIALTVELLTIPYIGNNIAVADNNKFIGANNYSYYLYNYRLPLIKPLDIMFNIN